MEHGTRTDGIQIMVCRDVNSWRDNTIVEVEAKMLWIFGLYTLKYKGMGSRVAFMSYFKYWTVDPTEFPALGSTTAKPSKRGVCSS